MQKGSPPPSLDFRASAWIVGTTFLGCVVALPVSLIVPWRRTAGTFYGSEQYPLSETAFAAAVLGAVYYFILRLRIPASDFKRTLWTAAGGYLLGAIVNPAVSHRRDRATWAENFLEYLKWDSTSLYGLSAAFAVCVWAEAVVLLIRWVRRQFA
ncbi:hypothetical protein [Alienimonas chondri]|uniref:ABC transporter permease n=1 Tax=Alienimonas chondri TaxID=2681879 RepID=A0ABX1VGG8_9PLAN|nr:hypothetical protein [Alienimonas chondri]NNJ25891.1 hypothetical protein [Alienimonas chondri]